jgi:hypothetical protein
MIFLLPVNSLRRILATDVTVGGDRGVAFFSGGEYLEQQAGAGLVQVEVSELVQAEQVDPVVAVDALVSWRSSAASASSLTRFAAVPVTALGLQQLGEDGKGVSSDRRPDPIGWTA